VDPRGLTLRVELDRARPPRGVTRVGNAGHEVVRLWTSGSRWGDEMLSFRIDETPIARTLQVYTVNVRSCTPLEPGDSLPLPFDLDDGTWEPRPPPSGRSLTAILQIAPSPEADAFDLWTGRVVSPPVSLTGHSA